jgi:uncharacterized protein involved in response to NO
MAPIPRLKPYDGPAILSYGFRPFFLAAAVHAALVVLLWLPQFFGELTLPIAIAPLDWHVHEMLYGYVPAVVTGFLLTAVPNWTGRLPLQGRPLLTLLLAWIAGRVAMLLSGLIGWRAAAVIDSAFLLLVAAAVAREVVSGRNWRNLKVLVLLLLLTAGNIAFHLEAHAGGSAVLAPRIAMAVAIGFIMLIGGRIVPSFTHNWLVRENPGRLPAGLDRFDIATVVIAGAALALWVTAPQGAGTGLALAAAAVAQGLRLARWAGWRTVREPLVLILHAAYAFVPLGFALTAAALLAPAAVPASAGIHAFTAGAIGVMTLAVMTRVSRGHTGRSLEADAATCTIYGLIIAAALARIAAALAPAATIVLLHVAALAWAGAFGTFAVVYGRMLLAPRVAPRARPVAA